MMYMLLKACCLSSTAVSVLALSSAVWTAMLTVVVDVRAPKHLDTTSTVSQVDRRVPLRIHALADGLLSVFV